MLYCALPEPVRKPVVMPANSTIYRWNEIAAALGHGTQVAVQQPANSFFLTDVEKVVDKVLNAESAEQRIEVVGADCTHLQNEKGPDLQKSGPFCSAA